MISHLKKKISFMFSEKEKKEKKEEKHLMSAKNCSRLRLAGWENGYLYRAVMSHPICTELL